MDISTLAELAPWDWPEEAATAIRAALESDDTPAEDRELAAEMAGELVVMDDEMAASLLALLRRAELSDEIRGAAALALGPCLEECDTVGFDEPDETAISEQTFERVLETLRELYHDEAQPTEVRRRALEASVRAPQDWHPDAVRAAHGSGDPDWRLTALFCMEYIRGFEPEILAALDSDSEEQLYHAICAAGAWEVDKAWKPVRAVAIDDSADPELRIAAIEALVGIRPAEAGEVLADLVDDDDEDVADAAAEAMALAESLAELTDEEEGDEGER